MDGNKKITGFVFAGIIALAITACKVQPTGYVGLYIDNLSSVNDTIDPDQAPMAMVDTAMTNSANTTSASEAEQPALLPPAEEIDKLSSDSVYQLEVNKLVKANTDAILLLNDHMIKLQKQLTEMPDTTFMREEPQELQPPDSLQTKSDFKHLLQNENDTIAVLRKQQNELQNFSIEKSDTVYMMRGPAASTIAESQQTDYLSQQLIRDKDEQMQRLQNQSNAMQNAPVRTPQQTYIQREPAQVQPISAQQTDQFTLQLFQSKNDTIQFLRNQLRNLQLQPQQRDSDYIEEETKEMQANQELVSDQKASDFQALQDTIQLLKTRVLSLEEQTVWAKDTPAAKEVAKDAPYNAKTDTTLIVAFYERGQIKPLEEESVFEQIKALISNKNVTKITLSGYTDSSGSELVNKEITNKRLNYLLGNNIPWIAKDKIFFQNFGDIFASDTMISDERRIEIRILTK